MNRDQQTKAQLFMKRARKDPAFFILKMRGLRSIKEPSEFTKGETLTQQQSEIVDAVRKAQTGEASRKITIASGHGIGKSTIIAMLIIRFLFCFKDSQVPTTAPTAPLLQDILWKEINNRLRKLPTQVRSLFDPTSDYIRVVENPTGWFARARTGKKETPEALAGVHADDVFLIADEASGVANEVYEASKGSLSGPHKLFLLIGNPTRNEGYFYDTHKKFDDRQKLQFSSEDSPIVDDDFIQTIVKEYGEDSDEYRIRVLGLFPREDSIDDKGYVPLVVSNDLRIIPNIEFIPRSMGIDVAGEGKDETVRVLRDQDIAKVIAREKVSNSYGVAVKTSKLIEEYGLYSADVYLDFFGIGAEVSVELAKMGINITNVNVGDPTNDTRYINLRAKLYWKLKDRLSKGGKLIDDVRKDILMMKYKRNERGLIKMMSKEDMRKLYGKSPDVADALMLTMMYEDLMESNMDQAITQKRY